MATCLSGAAAAAGGLLTDGSARRWLCAGVIAAYLIVVGLGVAFIQLSFFGKAFCRGKPGAMRAALTFDDGPDPAATPRLLDVLADLRAPATFFCVGERVRACPEIVRRAAAEGHALGNHSQRHAWWTNFLVGRGLRDEIARAQEAIGATTGFAPAHYRSPMGLTNPHLPGALAKLGLTLVGWDVRALDRGARPEEVVGRILSKVRDGSIVLLHDGGADPDTLVAAVRGAVRGLRERGYALVRVGELMGDPTSAEGQK